MFAVVLLASCNSKPKDLAVTVENPSDFDRTTDLVELPLEGLKTKVTLAEGQAYVVKNAKGDNIGHVEVVTDITALIQMQKEMENLV